MRYVTITIKNYGSAFVEEFSFEYYSYINLAKNNNLEYEIA